jgi:hypothetical protein
MTLIRPGRLGMVGIASADVTGLLVVTALGLLWFVVLLSLVSGKDRRQDGIRVLRLFLGFALSVITVVVEIWMRHGRS